MTAERQVVNGVKNLGAIESFTLPDDWIIGDCRHDAYGYLYTWHSEEHPDVSMSIAYSGRPLPGKDATSLHAILNMAPHTVSASELRTIRGLLLEKLDDEVFSIAAAGTRNIDGRRILFVNGTYLADEQADQKQADDEHGGEEHGGDEALGEKHADEEHANQEHANQEQVVSNSIFIDVYGDGRVIQEVLYLAPARAAAAYRSVAEQAFANLRLRNTVEDESNQA